MSNINRVKGEAIITRLYNQVSNIAASRSISVEERLACEALLDGLAQAFEQYDRMTANMGVKAALPADAIQLSGENSVNRIHLDKDMLSELIMAVNRKTIADEHIHLVDNNEKLQVLAVNRANESYPIAEMPSLFINDYKNK